MKKFILSLFIISSIFTLSYSTSDIEGCDEILALTRSLLSDKKVLKKYSSLVSQNYVWKSEGGSSGSMDEKGEFSMTILLHFEKPIKNEIEYKDLIIDFAWSRPKDKITDIHKVTIR